LFGIWRARCGSHTFRTASQAVGTD
jgi:hypothetical protein